MFKNTFTMGYYNDFIITILREQDKAGLPESIAENKAIFEEIEQKSDYTFNDVNDDTARLYEATWSDAVEDVESVARKHQNVIINLTCQGEDRNDNWAMRFHGDKEETITAEIEWPEFTTILSPEEKTPKARYQRFQNALKGWLDFQESLRKDILERLRKSPIDLTEYDFGKQKYFFLSQEESLYCKKAQLDGKGNIEILAGSTEDPDDTACSLSVEDMMQDIILLNDFMDCIYGNKENCLDEE